MFFHEPTIEGVIKGVEALEQVLPGFDPQALRDHAAGFTADRFRSEFAAFVAQKQAELADQKAHPQGR